MIFDHKAKFTVRTGCEDKKKQVYCAVSVKLGAGHRTEVYSSRRM